ncbi:HAD family hydrolase [Streptomyces griseoaurantiacus]|uniref:HAD family hydrolase n=1 Tax=Streptomyces griseoaurantiacus TaxID=68213 RepID=UPI0036CA92E4
MTVKGYMFDFSGTLMRVEPTADWLDAVLDDLGIEATARERAGCAARLERLGALPGGVSPSVLPDRLRPAWERRDLDPVSHRAAYVGLMREAELPWGEEVLDALYARHMTPAAWRPYPDTAEVLGELRRRGAPVAVVSNIGWDLRPVLREHRLYGLVDVFVLSYESGVQKPDPKIFRSACEALGLPAAQVLMVGDDRVADAGAERLGCRVRFVDHLPAHARPDALRAILDSAD